MRTIETVAATSGSPAAVWALLADASTWARWGSWSKVEVEGGGQQGPDAVRVLVRAPFRLRERITGWVPGKRMAYELLDGMRVRGYRAQVTLEEAVEGGTVVRWRSTYERAGPLTALMLRLAVRDACRRLAKAASP
jgi:Polyketide cyclase / dehydrase and lipid transport